MGWKKWTGVTKAKRDFARKTGIPTTRSGRQRKAGRMMGCSVFVLALAGLAVAAGVAMAFGR